MNTIEAALEAMRQGRPVLVLDDVDRENEGDVIAAGQTLTDEWTGWAIRHSSGYLCAPMPNDWADRLELPLMVEQNQDSLRTAYTITVDAAVGTTTGISAHDRATTVRLLASPDAVATDFNRPGHVVPLRARDGGVLTRRGHTEATVDLCRLAGLAPVGVIGELVHDDGSMMRTDAVLELGAREGLPVVTIADLAAWRALHDRVEEVARTVVPTEAGRFETVGFADLVTGAEHVAMISPHGIGQRNLVRLHSECLTGDALGSLRCDCGPQLRRAQELLGAEPGVLVYLRGHEGRGVGLLNKLRAYHLQDGGADTVDAQTQLGLPVDDREYGAAAAILTTLGVPGITLLTNNPEKAEALREAGLEVLGVRSGATGVGADNISYLTTKRDRMGHTLPTDLKNGEPA
ncbi:MULTISPECIES: 3,4-dihydroxy-2-butanone-4-phosphate synthase [unclassified Luteococcus]|uniref:3,4-dihydroxy-2-butanone-4-phosphate synthase n=1 Tax=unclassified Luteococcus TaxID=2639923 RepID=UPI00313C591A